MCAHANYLCVNCCRSHKSTWMVFYQQERTTGMVMKKSTTTSIHIEQSIHQQWRWRSSSSSSSSSSLHLCVLFTLPHPWHRETPPWWPVDWQCISNALRWWWRLPHCRHDKDDDGTSWTDGCIQVTTTTVMLLPLESKMVLKRSHTKYMYIRWHTTYEFVRSSGIFVLSQSTDANYPKRSQSSSSLQEETKRGRASIY